MSNNILIIGAGQLGSRHLQGLAKLKIPVTIEVVDPDENHLQIARERFNQAPHNTNVKSINYATSLHDSKKDYDLCIIATTADIRSSITKEILYGKTVKNIIFEKVLFQALKDYDDINELLTRKNVKAWVNCPRRIYPFYREIKPHFKSGERLFFLVSGGKWGLACNAIHFIDNAAFYNGVYDCEVDVSDLDPYILESRRKGFIEVSGTLKVAYSNKSELILHSKEDSNAPDVISILGETCHAVVFESLGKALISLREDNWQWNELRFTVPYQSELTNLVAEEILLEQRCSLTSFSDSAALHKPLIEALLSHIQSITDKGSDRCPIT